MLIRYLVLTFLLCATASLNAQDPTPTASPSPSPGKYTVVGPTGYQGSTEERPPIPPGTRSGGVLNGRAVSLPKPVYPEAARAAKVGGAVSVQVLVDEQGSVVRAYAVSGQALLRPAAVEAAKGAKFSPTIIEGQPVKVSGVITYNFVAPRKSQDVLLGLGYNLAEFELTKTYYIGLVEKEIPTVWTEEQALLEKIGAAVRKAGQSTVSLARVPETPKVSVATDKSSELKTEINATGPPRDTDRFTILGTSSGNSGTSIDAETVADVVSLQAAIARRLTNPIALWYFKLGQSLANLENRISDKASFEQAVLDMKTAYSKTPPSAAESLQVRLNEIIKVAETLGSDASQTETLRHLISSVRDL